MPVSDLRDSARDSGTVTRTITVEGHSMTDSEKVLILKDDGRRRSSEPTSSPMFNHHRKAARAGNLKLIRAAGPRAEPGPGSARAIGL